MRGRWIRWMTGAMAVGVFTIAGCSGGNEPLPDWCPSTNGICLSDEAILPYETIEVIATEPSWANATVHACVLPEGWEDKRGEPCDEAAELGIAKTNVTLQANENGRVRFNLKPMASQTDPRGTREPGQFRMLVVGPGDTPLSTRAHSVPFIVVEWEG